MNVHDQLSLTSHMFHHCWTPSAAYLQDCRLQPPLVGQCRHFCSAKLHLFCNIHMIPHALLVHTKKPHLYISCWLTPLVPKKICTSYEGFLKCGYPKIIHFKRMFHFKPSILIHFGYPHFQETPIYIHILYIYYMLVIISLVSSNCRALQHWGTQDTTEFLSSPMSVVWAKDFVNSWIDSTGNLQENLVKPLPTPRDLGLFLEIPRLLLGVKPATFFYQMWDRLRPHSNDTSQQYDIRVTWNTGYTQWLCPEVFRN